MLSPPERSFHTPTPAAATRRPPHAAAAAILCPDLSEGHGLQFLLPNEQIGKITRVLFSRHIRRQQGVQQGLLHIAEARDPRGDAVDRGVEVVQRQIHPAVQAAAADDLLAELLRFVIEQHHMVAVPAHWAGDVQGDLREEGQQRRDFVADHLGGVIVAVVHQGDAFAGIHGGVAQGELCTAHGVALHADAEHLALHAGLDLGKVKWLRENFVDGFLITHARPEAVSGNVLEAVARPDVHGTDLPQLLRQILRDAHAGPAVLDPEAAGFLVGGAERQRITLRVGEERRVEVRAEAVLFAEVHPRCKCFGSSLSRSTHSPSSKMA